MGMGLQPLFHAVSAVLPSLGTDRLLLTTLLLVSSAPDFTVSGALFCVWPLSGLVERGHLSRCGHLPVRVPLHEQAEHSADGDALTLRALLGTVPHVLVDRERSRHLGLGLGRHDPSSQGVT